MDSKFTPHLALVMTHTKGWGILPFETWEVVIYSIKTSKSPRTPAPDDFADLHGQDKKQVQGCLHCMDAMSWSSRISPCCNDIQKYSTIFVVPCHDLKPNTFSMFFSFEIWWNNLDFNGEWSKETIPFPGVFLKRPAPSRFRASPTDWSLDEIVGSGDLLDA